jgi:uncharacterized protein
MTAADPDLAPVAAHERIQALDVVRGFALLGIFMMNLEFFARPMQDIAGPGIDPAATGADRIAEFLVFFFVQSKFWTLFSLLFGMGFAVMIERARRAGRPFVPAYLRRSLALLGIGLVHALLVWAGDILVTYAIGALVLLVLFRGSTLALLAVGAVHAAISQSSHVLVYYLAGAILLFAARWAIRAVHGRLDDMPPMPVGWFAWMGATLYAIPLIVMLCLGAMGTVSPSREPPTAEQQQAEVKLAQVREAAVVAYRDGSYADATHQRVIDTAEQLEIGNLLMFLPMLLGIYLLGIAILRSGVMERPREHETLLRRMRDVGLTAGFALMALSTWLGTGMNFAHFGMADAVQVVSYLAAGLVLALAYGATVVLALGGPMGPWLGRWLAPAGRMALTNYLAQSVFGTLVFYGYGLGMWDRLGRAEGVLLGLGFYALQLVASRAWLSRFRFGPAEWLWRALTYLHLPPMRREAMA